MEPPPALKETLQSHRQWLKMTPWGTNYGRTPGKILPWSRLSWPNHGRDDQLKQGHPRSRGHGKATASSRGDLAKPPQANKEALQTQNPRHLRLRRYCRANLRSRRHC